MRFIFAALLLLAVKTTTVVSAEENVDSSKTIVTGHRLVRNERDLALYVIGEPLPTVLLVHSSNVDECIDGTSCLEMYESFKESAIETKGYIRFASVDTADKDAADLVKSSLRIENQKLPIIYAFSEKAVPGIPGRPAMRLPMEPLPTGGVLKRISADLLPKNVHRSKNAEDFQKIMDVGKDKKVPLVALLAPKLSDKPTAMIKAAWAIVMGTANFTLVDYSTLGGKEVAKRLSEQESWLQESIMKNETFIVGIDTETSKIIRNNDTSPLSPDTISEFTAKLVTITRKKTTKRTGGEKQKTGPVVPPGVYSNITQEEFEQVVTNPNPACVVALRRGRDADANNSALPDDYFSKEIPPSDPATNFTFENLAGTLLSNYGAHSAIVHCDHPTNPPKICSHFITNEGTWAIKVFLHRGLGNKDAKKSVNAKTLGEAQDLAIKSLIDQEKNAVKDEDKLETFASASALDFISASMNTWANPSLRDSAKLPFIYLDNEASPSADVPPFLRACHATMRDVARIVHVRNPSDEMLRAIHLDPATTFLPSLVAYLPNLNSENDEDPKEKVKKGSKKDNKPPPKGQMTFHVIPFESQRKYFGNMGLQYDTCVLFSQQLLHQIENERFESFMEKSFVVTAPYALSKPILDRLSKTKGTDSLTKIPQAEKAVDKASLKTACESNGSSGICVVVFVDPLDKSAKSREEVVEEARKTVEKAGLGQGVRIAIVDGTCHTRVVEALGGDPTMLPVVSVWSQSKNGYSIMRGTFTAETIQTFIRQTKRGAVGVQPVTKSPFDSFSDPKDCFTGNTGESSNYAEEDDLLNELREEQEREMREKEIALKQAEEEGKRLKAQRDAELKSQKDKMNTLAEEERLKRRKVQQELDEQRMAKKKEQQRLDEERLKAKQQEQDKKKKTEL